MKKIIKRIYDFTFEQLIEKLELEGNFEAYDSTDDKGKDSSVLKIFTVEVKEDKKD